MQRASLLLAVALLVPSGVAAQVNCTCTRSTTQSRGGGDGSPLRWSSRAVVASSGSATREPEYCYEREVWNDSGSEVRDIYWPVAKYEKDGISSKASLCESTPVPGVVRQPDPSGPLNFGAGARSYPTTVFAPANGWSNKMTGLKAPETPDLTSTIEVMARGGGKTTLTLTSSARRVAGGRVYHYEIRGNGPSVRVFWNVPVTPAFAALEFLPGAPTGVTSGVPVTREVQSADQIGIAVADVHIYNSDLQWLGSGVATVYGSINGQAQTPLPRARSLAQ